MSFFKKIAASVGVGSADVDTILEKPVYHQGETVRGTVHIQGGSVEQEIDDIDLMIMARYIMERNGNKVYQQSKIDSHMVVSRLKIHAKEKREIPFEFQLPYDTPVSFGQCKVWLKTNLDIDNGLDATDNDQLEIRPHPWVKKILDAVTQSGFNLREADCEYAPYFQRRLPFVQEFEFRPRKGRSFRRSIDEIEVICHVDQSGVEVILEVDRKSRGAVGWLEEHYNLDETFERLNLNSNDMEQSVEQLTEKFNQLIQRHLR